MKSLKIRLCTSFVFVLALFFVACSSNDDDVIDDVVLITTHVSLKDKDSNNPIVGANVFLNGEIDCSFWGCGPVTLAWGKTNSNGEISFSLSPEDNARIERVSWWADNYGYGEVDYLSNNVIEVFLTAYK